MAETDVKIKIDLDINGDAVLKELPDRFDKVADSSKKAAVELEKMERAKELVEARAKALSRELDYQIQLLKSSDPALTRVVQHYDRLKGAANGNAEILAKIAEARSLEISRLDQVSEASKKAAAELEKVQRAKKLAEDGAKALSRELDYELQLLKSSDPALTRIVQHYDRLKGAANGNAEVLAKIAEARSLEISRLGDAGKALDGAKDKHGSLAGASQHLGTVINATAQQFGVFGQHTSIFAGALSNLLVGVITPAAVGFTGLGLAFAFATQQIEKRREELARESEREIATLEKAKTLLEAENSIREKIKGLRAADTEVGEITAKYEAAAKAIEKLGKADEIAGTLAKNNEAKQLEINKILNARQLAAGQAQQTIINEIALSELRTAALGGSAAAVSRLNVEQQLQAIETRRLAGEHGALLDILARRTVEEYALSEALRLRDSGKAGASQFEQVFGVKLAETNNQTAVDLVDAFIPIFNQFGRDGRNAAAFQQAFQSLVQQALATGAPDIQELLLSRGLSSQSLERLKAGLGGDLRAALDESRQAGQQWGASFEQETFRVTQAFQQVGFAIDALARQLSAIQNRALNIPITFSESPARPFSEFIPTMQAHFTQLNSLVESRTPSIDIPVSGLPQQIAGLYGTPGFSAAYTQYQNLTRAIATERDNYYAGYTAMNYGIGQANMATAARRQAQFQAQLDTLLVTAGSDAYGAARSGGGGGGAPSVAVTIDLRGSNVTPGFLDDSLIPALERGIIRATGQAPDFRVLN